MAMRRTQYPDARILVVDDNPVDAGLLEQAMLNAGYRRVTVINDPRHMAEQGYDTHFDVILLDLNMPHLDGFDILKLMRERRQDMFVPVLVITAQHERAVRLRALELGAKDFITKPYDAHELLNRIHNALEVRTLHQQVLEQNKTLARRESDLRMVLDNVLEGIFTLDEAGTIQSVNLAAQNLFGYPPGEVIGASLAILIPPSGGDGSKSLFEKLRSRDVNGIRNEEAFGVRRDGTTFPLELSMGEVAGGESRLFVGICRDITDRKLSDAAMKLAKEELEQRVRARTAALTAINARLSHEIDIRKAAEVELAAARDKAVEASKLKSQFLANVSHEIRTPLNGILGMLSLLLNSRIDSEQQDFALTAFKSGELLLALINDILDFSKVESGRLELEHIGYDVRQLVYDVVHLYEEPSRKKGVDIVSLVAPDVPPMLIGDPGRLRQIVTNLVGNALKFTEKGEVLVHVQIDGEVDGDFRLRVDVRDTGVGIAEQAQKKIFESFTQADGSTTRRFGGTGLGLAICKQLVELMNGAIGVESRLGEGSHFWFWVSQGKYHGTASSQAARVDLAGLRALIVSDASAKVSWLEQRLMGLGVSFEKCADESKAVSILRDAKRHGRPFKFVLVNSAGLAGEGLDFVRSLYASIPMAELRVVLLALSGFRGFGRDAREAGVAAYITEPVDHQMLEGCLTAALAAAPGETPLITRHSLAEQAASFKARVLVVDDNPVNQKVAAKMLSKLGARADVAPDGVSALDAVKKTRYDIILMDCLMPEMDGFETTRRIRNLEQAADGTAKGALAPTPIIAMTANVRQEDKEKCLTAGMNDFVAKPVTLDTLRAVLATWTPETTN